MEGAGAADFGEDGGDVDISTRRMIPIDGVTEDAEREDQGGGDDDEGGIIVDANSLIYCRSGVAAPSV